METFRAFRIDSQDDQVVAGLTQLSLDDLTEGDVVIKVSHSTINYKDALAATGAGKILRRYPLNGGIDLAGEIVSSGDPELPAGLPVLINGCGLSETVDGGYSEYARVAGSSVVPIPAGMTAFEAMQIGTAGYTAALAIHRMEQNGQQPGNGPVVVTGATGGVGSIAIDMLAARGYEAVAVTGKAAGGAYLESIGATSVLLRDEIDVGRRPMERAQWAGNDELRRQYREHRPGREPCPVDNGSAVHPARGVPARHQFGRYAARFAAGGLVPHRQRSPAAPSRHHRRSDHWPRRVARRLPGLY
jgi:NADPH2:quinone reductase